MDILLCFLVALIAYCIGSISTGLLLAKMNGVDIRKHGSNNVGASNMLRVMGAKLGFLTLAGDFLKAILACFIGQLIMPEAFGFERIGVIIAGLFVVIGHNWPVFFGFKGGKGVACSAAVVLFASPLWGGLSCIICIAIIATSKYISLGSLCLVLSFMILSFFVVKIEKP